MSDLEIHIKFETDLPAPLRIDGTPYTVPADSGPDRLNEIVNSVLDLPTPERFDFLINGLYLRTTLQQFRADHDISSVCLQDIRLLILF